MGEKSWATARCAKAKPEAADRGVLHGWIVLRGRGERASEGVLPEGHSL